ncbi:3'-5' exonuclease [Candidatus Gracilibacteria bacterium]|nr:3'-5' exonuclease [Candidatus Gracilibacteria bacterium]
MKIFVFDTETTGFIDKKNPSLEAQPKIVQFAGIFGTLENGNFQEEKRIDILIDPKIPIPFAASQVHHIYDIDIKGAPEIHQKIDDFLEVINDADAIIGHNIEYDEQMILLELKRLQKEYAYQPKQVICTMKSSVEYCALQGKGERLKYPKLGELHKKLFDEYFIGAHDALTDVEATLRCFTELVHKGVIELKETKQEVMSLF